MKLVIFFPPDYDGELHAEINRIPNGAAGEHLTFSCTIAMEPGETALATVRRLGQHLRLNPAKLYYGTTEVHN